MNQHVHLQLDQFGRCTSCGKQVLTHFKGFPLPKPPQPSK